MLRAPQDNQAIALFRPRLIGYLCIGSSAATFSFIAVAQSGLLDFTLHHLLLDAVIGLLLLVVGLISLKNPALAVRLFRGGLLALLLLLAGLAYVDPERQMSLFFIGLVIIGAFITINTAFGTFISVLSVAVLLALATIMPISTEMMTYIALFYTTSMLLGWIIGSYYESFLKDINHYEAQLADQAYTDELTQLPNRRGFLLRGERLFEQCRNQNRPLTLAIIDLDHFKQLNDRFGHVAGDAALRHVACLIRQTFRSDQDLYGRMGGDELMVILPDMTIQAAQQRLRLFVRLLARQPLMFEGTPLPISLSIGLTAMDPQQDASLEDLIRRADQALYRAKTEGRGRVKSTGPVKARPQEDSTLESVRI